MIQGYYPKTGAASGTHLWRYVEAPTKEEQKQLIEKYDLKSHFVHDALDVFEIPRVELRGDTAYIITRFTYKTKGGTVKTAPILFAIREHELITVSRVAIPNLDNIIDEGDHSPGKQPDPIQLMLTILLEIDSLYDAIINERSHAIRSLRSKLGKRNLTTKDFIGFVTLEDTLNDFLNSLEPTNVTLAHMASSDEALFKNHQELLNTVLLNNKESIQACHAQLKSLEVLRRTYSLISSNNLDRTIKILTTVSVLIAIPTMLFSMYGMNVHLPWQNNGDAFPMIFTLSILTAVTAFIIGRHKKIF